MAEFEEMLRTAPGGYVLSWPELKRVATKIEDTNDCTIVAAASAEDIIEARTRGGGTSAWEYYIEAFDSTEWTLSSRDKAVGHGFSRLAQCTRALGDQ